MTEASVMMATVAPVSSPLLLKPIKQKDVSLQKKLSKDSLATTAATEDLSCDESSTCRSKSSSSGSFTTPGGKKNSTLKMTILMNKSAEFSMDEEVVFPSAEECNFVLKDDSPWWSSSPVKQGKKDKTDEPSSRAEELKRETSTPKLASGQCDSPVSQTKKPTDTISTQGVVMEESQQQPVTPSECADSQQLAMNDDQAIANNDSNIRDRVSKPTSPVKRASKTENYGDSVEGRESPSKRREKKKQTGKRMSVSKVKASDLVNRFFNASGETIADPKELQEAIRLWKAEQRLSASEVESARKESTRGRRSSLDVASKTDSPQKLRSRSKVRLVTGDGVDKTTQSPCVRSVSKSRRKTKEPREESRTVADLQTPTSTADHPTPTSSDNGKVGRSRSIVRKATTEAGIEHARSVSLARTSTQGARKSRGRSVAKKSENDGGKKRTSSLAKGLAKLYNESSDDAFADGQGDTSVFHKSDASRATARSDDIMVVERRRTHSLARGLKKVSKDDHCRGDVKSQRRHVAPSVSSEDNAAARRRSRSVGAGLREETTPAPAPAPAPLQAALARRTVARRNSSNVSKRRSLSRRREEDDFTKMANLSFQDDDFFASIADLQLDHIE